MTHRIEYASASLSWLQGRIADTNGCDHAAQNELRRRTLAELTGTSRRTPAERLRELELRRHPDGSPRNRLIATYAMCRHTRDPHRAMLALWAMRIDQGW
jgi:hypothetical protein